MSTTEAATSYPEYDAMGRVLRSTQTIAGTAQAFPFEYTYNHLAPATVKYPSQRVISYGYDSAARIDTVSGVAGAVTTDYVTGVQYGAHGAPERITLAHGRYEEVCFNARLQPWAMLLRTAAPNGLCTETTGNALKLGLGYGTGNNGNLMAQTISDGVEWSASQSYDYDKLNRLGWAQETGTGSGWKQSYGYDRWGNRWVDSGNTYGLGSQTEDTFTGKNRLNLPAGSFDRAGNQTRHDPHTLAYDGENRLAELSSAENGSASYRYDGEGRRVKQIVGGMTTYFVYDAFGQLAAEYVSGGAAPAAHSQPVTCLPIIWGAHERYGTRRGYGRGSTICRSGRRFRRTGTAGRRRAARRV